MSGLRRLKVGAIDLVAGGLCHYEETLAFAGIVSLAIIAG
jgi:hypothetical protein